MEPEGSGPRHLSFYWTRSIQFILSQSISARSYFWPIYVFQVISFPKPVCTSSRIHTCHMPLPSDFTWFCHPDSNYKILTSSYRPNSYFCKPLNNNSEGFRPTRSPQTSASDEKWRFFNFFFSVGSG